MRGVMRSPCPVAPSTRESAENLTNHNEAELQRRCQERQQEINDMQEVLETKIQLLQEVGARPVGQLGSSQRTMIRTNFIHMQYIYVTNIYKKENCTVYSLICVCAGVMLITKNDDHNKPSLYLFISIFI